MPLVDDVVMLMEPGATGATGNVYVGLAEFADMAFLMHFLRREDRFLDVGANVGVYTLLAAGGCGAECVAVEPVPSTFQRLVTNLRVNGLGSRVRAANVGLSSKPGKLRFTRALDTVNHVVAEGESAEATIDIDVTTVDDVTAGATPALIKIDVEGFETEVFAGARATMASSKLEALIVELNGSGTRYGYDEQALHESIVAHGFSPHTYDPLRRELRPLDGKGAGEGNTLYLRDPEAVARRLSEARAFRVLGLEV
jgi:FkbM family methyltransferase